MIIDSEFSKNILFSSLFIVLHVLDILVYMMKVEEVGGTEISSLPLNSYGEIYLVCWPAVIC